jgi:hypothetical protein
MDFNMNSKQFAESTTSGAIASDSTPVGKTQTRGKGVYPNEKGGNLLTGKKTNKRFANTVKESNEQGVAEGASTDDKKQISKYEELALAANRAGDDEKCKLYQKKIQALKQKMSQSVAEGSDELKVGIEAYGVRGVNSNKWKKTFKSQEAFEKWLDQNEGDVEVSGTREVNLNDMFKESMKEAKLDEEDIIIVPGQGKKYKQGFIPKAKDRTDHEVEMALSDLFQSAKNAKQVYELIKDIPESVGIEGWVQEKIIKANDYLNTVREYLEHKQMGQGMAEGYRILPNIDRERYQEREGLEGPFRARNGKVYYYDPKAGLAYDPDTDMYIDYDELKMMDSDTMYENLQDDFSAFLKDLEKNTGIKGSVRAPGMQQQPKPIQPASTPTQLSTDQIKNLKAELSILQQKFDPNYERSDDYSYWNIQKAIHNQIRKINSQLRSSGQVEEGMLAKAAGALALIASLWGVSEYAAKDAYENSPQLQKLVQYHQQATQMGDEAKIQELERRIENHKTRLSLGKGEVMGPDDKPIVPTYEGLTGNERPRETKKEDDRITAAYRKKHLSSAGKKDDVKKDDIKKESSIMKGLMKEQKCPECGGKLVAESELNEEGNKDACYHKVKSRYKVWPSAYASGALVKCRKVGASNWGNKSK